MLTALIQPAWKIQTQDMGQNHYTEEQRANSNENEEMKCWLFTVLPGWPGAPGGPLKPPSPF